MIGKHQFVVSSIDVASGANDGEDEEMSIEALMGDAEELLQALEDMSVEQKLRSCLFYCLLRVAVMELRRIVSGNAWQH